MPRGWFGWGRGFGNPFPFCRWFPWLPRWWWAYPAFLTPYYWTPYYAAYWFSPYRYLWYRPY